MVGPFWSEVSVALQEILGYPIPWDPAMVLLGIRPPELQYQDKADRIILWNALGAAKSIIALYWKKAQAPHLLLVLQIVAYHSNGKVDQ